MTETGKNLETRIDALLYEKGFDAKVGWKSWEMRSRWRKMILTGRTGDSEKGSWERGNDLKI